MEMISHGWQRKNETIKITSGDRDTADDLCQSCGAAARGAARIGHLWSRCRRGRFRAERNGTERNGTERNGPEWRGLAGRLPPSVGLGGQRSFRAGRL